ncbi:MAG TPA: Hsp20 family protein, partial [Chitinophagaceae bacterium]|nr:Hsp20 family protein [Chitinophagaceae bacterium]
MSSLIKKSSLFPQWGFMDAVFREPFSDWMNSAPFQTVPAVNISESKDQFVIEMAAPGLKKEDFSIEVDGTHMTIQCEKEVKKEDKEKNYRKQEFSYSCFSRSFS